MIRPTNQGAAPLQSSVGWRKRMGARKAGRVPRKRSDPLAFCAYFDATTMRHRFTGQLRAISVLDSHVVFFLEDRRQVRRSHQKALQWIANAIVVGGVK